MRSIRHRRFPYAAGYAIRSDRWHLLPWVAASLAAHGMLLYLFYISFDDAFVTSSGGQVMIVALQDDVMVPAHDQPQLAGDHKPVPQMNHAEVTAVARHEYATATHAARVQRKNESTSILQPARSQQQTMSAGPADRQGMGDHAVTAMAHAAAAVQAAADGEQRLQRVRRHLEHFKYYPASARRRGIEGQVEVAFDLDARGMASRLQLLSRSGYRILDRAALETVRRASPFPARGGHYRFQLVFRKS